MSERGARIQRLLAALARHADVVAQAFDGPVLGGARQTDAAIAALFAEGALKPYAEGSYRLHPRLREFFADILASYQAFEALRRISGTLKQASVQWQELCRLKLEGAPIEDQERLYFAFEDSVADIAYSIEHNMRMLHALISTQYGNVSNLKSKIRQNNYYLKEVDRFLKDVAQIGSFVDAIINQSIAYGMPQARRLVVQRMESKCLGWSAQIKDAQAVISQRLFRFRLMEERLRRLSRYALWLQRNPTQSGWDTAPDERTPLALVRFDGLSVRPQPDITDPSPKVSTDLADLAAKMPPPRAAVSVTMQPAETQYVIGEGNGVVFAQDDLVRETLRALLQWVREHQRGASLLKWKNERAPTLDVSDEIWLFWAASEIMAEGLRVQFLTEDEDSLAVNEHFYDIVVEPS